MDKFVSIILPVRNEARYIEGCLKSIIAQDYPHDRMEVLIIDGQSTDGTVDKVNEFKAEPFDIAQGKSSKFKEGPDSSDSRAAEQTQNDGVGIRVLDNPDRTVPYAMNLGIANARGDIILRFDGHAVMEPDYVSNCVKCLEQTKADNVGGPAINISNGTAIGDAILLSHNSAFGLGGGAFRMGNYEGFTDTVTFGCFPKETFAKYGLYDERLTRNQDIELNARIRKGIKLNSEFRIQNSENKPRASVALRQAQCIALCEKGVNNSDSSTCGAGYPAQNDDKENLSAPATLCEGKEPEFPIGSVEYNSLDSQPRPHSLPAAEREAGRQGEDGNDNTAEMRQWSGITSECGIKSEKTEKESNLGKSAQSADREAPGKIYLTPKIKSYYYCRNTLSGLWSQNFKNGQWVVYTKYIAPYALSLRHFVPLAFVATILILTLACLISLKSLIGSIGLNGFNVLNKFGSACLLLLVLELMAYFGTMLFFVCRAGGGAKVYRRQETGDSGKGAQFKAGLDSSACGAGSQAQNDMNNLVPWCLGGKKSTPGSLLLLPLVFLTLHFSYGLGSIWGLVTLAGWAKKRNNV